MRDIHRHMDEEELEQYSDGAGTPEQTAALETHLLTCEECRNQLLQTDEYVLAMRSAAGHERRAARTREREWSVPTWFPAFAAAACGLLLFVAVRYWQAPSLPAATVDLVAMRGAGTPGAAPAGRALLLHPDLTGLAASPSYRIQVVDQTGREVRQSLMEAARGAVQFTGLRAGVYFVRVYLPGGELLREYGLEVR
ncbi:MAG: zf-HC2 domain-containing protein [Candidatus Solibacter sp.]